MRRYTIFVLVFVLIGILASCTSLHYQEKPYVINGFQVYRYDHRTSEVTCDRISQMGLFVRDGDEDYVTDEDFGECMNTLFVKENGTYYNLTEAISIDLFTIDDVLDVEWTFDVYQTHDLLDYTDVDYFVFITTVSETYNDIDNIERILSISESVYQKFIIGYSPSSMDIIGQIEVYSNEMLIVTLEVYEQGIYDPSTGGFQENNSSELYGLFQSIMV